MYNSYLDIEFVHYNTDGNKVIYQVNNRKQIHTYFTYSSNNAATAACALQRIREAESKRYQLRRWYKSREARYSNPAIVGAVCRAVAEHNGFMHLPEVEEAIRELETYQGYVFLDIVEKLYFAVFTTAADKGVSEEYLDCASDTILELNGYDRNKFSFNIEPSTADLQLEFPPQEVEE